MRLTVPRFRLGRVLSFVFILPFLLPVKSTALELYSLITGGCRAQTGLIVNTDETTVRMLTLDGTMAEVPRQMIEVVLVYNIHDSPFQRLDLTSELQASLREVEVDDNENTHFIGWPIRFIENLIVFYDIDGKTHLVDIDRIKRFSYPDTRSLGINSIANYTPVRFGLGDNLPECRRKKAEGKKIIEPTRMISDRIRVHKFFSVYQAGFAHLQRFQKKTLFYAKPFLYEKETRLGLIYTKEEYRRELNFLLPLYFQWSNGSPYGSQGEYVIGSKSVELLPSVEPQAILRADGKSHFFTGSFVGNMLCLSGGSDCIIKNRQLFTEFFSTVGEGSHAVYTQFNYLALTGVDFKEYSFSAGFYYPVYGIWGNGTFREVKSTHSSPIVRFMKTTKDTVLRVTYGQSSLGSDSPSDDGIELIRSSELEEYAIKSGISEELIDSLASYDLKAQYLRVGFDYDLSKEVSIGLGEVVSEGEYSERLSGEAYRLEFLHLTTSLSLKQRFSDYTMVRGEVNYFSRQHDYKAGNQKGDSDEEALSFAIYVEFFL